MLDLEHLALDLDLVQEGILENKLLHLVLFIILVMLLVYMLLDPLVVLGLLSRTC